MNYRSWIVRTRNAVAREGISAAIAPWVEARMNWIIAGLLAGVGHLGDLPTWAVLCIAFAGGLLVTEIMGRRIRQRETAAVKGIAAETWERLEPMLVERAREEFRTVLTAHKEEIIEQVAVDLTRMMHRVVAFALTMNDEDRLLVVREEREATQRNFTLLDEASGGLLSLAKEKREQAEAAISEEAE